MNRTSNENKIVHTRIGDWLFGKPLMGLQEDNDFRQTNDSIKLRDRLIRGAKQTLKSIL